MNKRFWVVWVKRNLITLAVVFIVGLFFDRFVTAAYDRSGLLAGVYAVGIYMALSAALGILNAIAHAVYYLLFFGNDMSGAVLDDLRGTNIAPPDDWAPKSFAYLEHLAGDPEASPEERVKAAFLWGSYKSAMQRGFFASIGLHKAIDDAVLRYAQEAPRRRPI